MPLICCTSGKVSFASAQDAWRVLLLRAGRRSIHKTDRPKGGSVYRCSSCAGWHITHRDERAKRRTHG